MREFGDVLYECILAVIVNQKSDNWRMSAVAV